MNALTTLALVTLVATGGEPPITASDKKDNFGAVVGPAVLPAGATAAYAFVGLPQLGAGFRQGLTFGEWEVRGRADYLTLSASGELIGKYALYRWGRLEYGPFLGAGITFSSGSRYYDQATFPFIGLRATGGAVLSYKATDAVRVVARLEAPFDWPLGTGGGARLQALAGGGAEVYLADDVTVVALGEAGLDWIKEPLGVPVSRFGYLLVFGIGFRLF